MWTRSLACCIALLTLVAPPVLGLGPDDAALRGACSDAHWLAISTATVPVANPTGANAQSVVVARQPVCPGVTGWTEKPLFAGLRFSGPLFCLYDRQPAAAAKSLAGVHDLHAAVRLCGVVVPLGQAPSTAPAPLGERSAGGRVAIPSGITPSPVPPLDSELLYRELRFQVGATDLPLKSTAAPNVRLAVVDTQPTGGFGASSIPGQGSPHGFDLAAIARDLTCNKSCGGADSPVGPCASTITTRLALNMSSAGDPPTTDETRGGYFGRPSDVARAIVREVDDWLDAGSPQHLVVNVSLGWDPDLLHPKRNAEDTGAHLDAEEPGTHANAEELAVYAALDYARTQGALPIAASGNSPGGSQPGHGATAPGRWFAKPPDTGGYFTAVSDPVVWAVGAVDRDDRPLANVRVDSLPPIVGYGDHAVAPLPSGTGWTEPPLTGSSVSAIVASSLAAVAWDLRPELDADGIMTLLARSGRALQRPAEIYRLGSSFGLRQASTSSGTGVQPVPSIRRLWFYSALSDAWSREGLNRAQAAWTAPPVQCDTALPLSCGDPFSYWICPGTDPSTQSAWTPQTACPQNLLSIGSVPWVLPQPGQDPCPTCSISSGTCPTCRLISGSTGWQIKIVIPGGWAAGSGSPSQCFTSLVLESGTDRLVIFPPGGQVCSGQSLLVTGLPFDPGQGTAAITFQIKGQIAGQLRSVRSPLYVDL